MEVLLVIIFSVVISAAASGILTALGMVTFWVGFWTILGAFCGIVIISSGGGCDF